MEFPSKTVVVTGKRSGLGRCKHFFWLGVLFDTVGVAVLFTGVFADLLFYDMLLYLGSVIIFFSLLWWVSWYTGNIELLPEEAMPRDPRRPSGSVAADLRRTISLRFSQTFATFSSALERLRRRRTRGRSARPTVRTSVLSLPLPSESEREMKSEDRGGLRVEPPDGAPDGREEAAGPVPEVHRRAEAVGSPGPAAGGKTYLQKPPLPPYCVERRPPFPLHLTKSQPVTSLVPAPQPGAFPASKSETVFSLVSARQPPVTLPLTSQAVAPVVAQSHPPVPGHFQDPLAAQSHLLVPVASQSQNLPPSSETQPVSVQDSESRVLTPQVSVTALFPDQSFLTMDLQPSRGIQDFKNVYSTQQFPRDSSLLQVSTSQSAALLEISKKIVAQVFENLPLPTQKLPQELPDTVSSVPEATEPAAESQQSVPTDSTDLAAESQQELPDTVSSVPEATEPAAEPKPPVPADSADPAAEPQPPVPTDSADPAAEPQPPVPTDSADPAAEPQPPVPTDRALDLKPIKKSHSF